MNGKLKGFKPRGVDAFRARGAEGTVTREKGRQESRYSFSDIPVKGESLVMVVTDRDEKRIGVIPEKLRKPIQFGEIKIEDAEREITWYNQTAAAEGRAVPVPTAV